MSYDYAGNRRCQYDFPRSVQPFRPYQPVQPRRVTCWDPPASRVEVLRPPSWPDPESPYVSHHLDPPDPSRRLSAMTRRGDGQSGLSLRDNPEGSNPPRTFPGSSEIFSAGLEKIMARFDKLESRLESCEEIDRRVKNLHASKAAYRRQSYADFDSGAPIEYRDRAQDARARPRSGYAERSHLFDRRDQRVQLGFDRHPIHATQPHRPTCWDPPTQQQDRGYPTFDHRPRRTETCWDRPHPQEEVRARRQPASHQPRYPPEQPRHDLYYQPARVTSLTPDQPPHSPTCWDSPEVLHAQPMYQPPQCDRSLGHRTATLPVVAPSLKVRSSCPAQLDAVSDYNEKLRIYRLEQAALLARLNCVFEENIDDKNLAEDVPDNVAHNGGVNLDVPNNESLEEVPNDESLEEIVKPNDESLEEIVKTDNMPPQVLVGAYDEKIGDLIVPEHRELEIQDDIETFVEENVVCYEEIVVLITSLLDRNIGATQVNSKSSRSHIMFTGMIESWCRSSLQSAICYQQRPLMFDPGGDASPKLLLSTLSVASWFPP